MTTCIIYTRISKDRADQTSLDSQEDVCRAYAKAQGWEVVKVESDRGRSAFNGRNRPGWNRTLTAIETGAADVLLVWALDRAARSTRQLADVLTLLDERGASFASATQPLDTSSPMGRAMVTIIGTLAELESAMKSERTSAWHESRNAAGKAPVGPRVFGYDKTEGRYVPNPTEAVRVREVFDRLDRGEAQAAVARAMNDAGIRTTQNREWGPMTVKVLVMNPSVAGLREVDGVLVEAPWEPLVDREQWDRVTAAIAKQKGSQARGSLTMLGGVLRCGRCDSVLHHQPHHQNGKARYVCSGERCSLGIIDIIDDYVSDAIITAIDPDSWAALRASADGRQAEHLAELQTELADLAGRYGAGELTRIEWDAVRPALVDRITTAERAVDSEPMSVKLPEVDDLGAEWSTLDVMARRLVIETVLDSIRIAPARRGYNKGLDPARVEMTWRV